MHCKYYQKYGHADDECKKKKKREQKREQKKTVVNNTHVKEKSIESAEIQHAKGK